MDASDYHFQANTQKWNSIRSFYTLRENFINIHYSGNLFSVIKICFDSELRLTFSTKENKLNTDPFGELRVHHEIMHMFLGATQLQFAGDHGDNECRTTGTLLEWDERGCKCLSLFLLHTRHLGLQQSLYP